MEQIENFIKDITHELNTPITALKLTTSRALKKGVYSPNTLKNISISTNQLYDIYTSLTYLNFKQEFNDIEVDLADILNESIEYYSQLASSKGIEIISNIDSKRFIIDHVKAKLLFSNLISNAIKYSYPNSKIEIELKNSIFKVLDYGIGIAADKQEFIFKRFHRESSYGGGFGIGLDIVKNICDEYGIKIEVKSKVECGSTFSLLFN